MTKWSVYKEELFRTPLRAERAVGLWVDRIGSGTAGNKPTKLRMLGQYAAVHVDRGGGTFYSPTCGEVGVRAGQAMILFPDEPHAYYTTTGWATRWVVWSGPDADALAELGYLAREHAVVNDRIGAVGAAHAKLQGIIGSEDVAAVLERKCVVLTMVLDLSRSIRQVPRRRRHDDLMAKAAAFLGEHFTERIAMDDLAGRFHVSPAHFRRLFRAYTGRGPCEFVTSLRISKAKELLSGGRSVKEVAALVGYEDLFYFMRVFKKVTGIPPGKFGIVGG